MADNQQESFRDRIRRLSHLKLRWSDVDVLLVVTIALSLMVIPYGMVLKQFNIDEATWWAGIPKNLAGVAAVWIFLSYIERRNIREDQESEAVESDDASD